MDTRRINYGNPFDTTGFDKISDMISSLKARMRSTPVGQGINSLENALQKMLGPMNEDQIALFNRLKADVGGLDMGGFNMLGPVKDLAGKPVKPAVAELIRRIQEIKKEVPNVKPSLVKATVPQQMFAKYQPELKEVLSGGTIKDEALSKVANQIDDRFNISHTQYPEDYGGMQQTLRRGPAQDVVLMNINEATTPTIDSPANNIFNSSRFKEALAEHRLGGMDDLELSIEEGPLSEIKDLIYNSDNPYKEDFKKILNNWYQADISMATQPANVRKIAAERHQNIARQEIDKILNHIEGNQIHPTEYNPGRFDPDINKWAALEERNNGVHAQIKGTDWTKEDLNPEGTIYDIQNDLEEYGNLHPDTVQGILDIGYYNPDLRNFIQDHEINLNALGTKDREILEPIIDMLQNTKLPSVDKHGQHNVGWFRVDDFSHPESLFTGEDVPFDFEHPDAQNPFYLIDEVQSDLDTYKQRYYVDRDKIKESNPEDILNWFKSNPDMTNYQGYKFNDERLNNYYNKHINSEPNKLLDSQLTSWLDPEEVAWKDLVNSYINDKFKVPTGVNLKQEFKPEYGEWENVMMSNIIDQAIKDKAQNIFLHSPESIKLKGDGAGSIDSVNQRYYDKLPKRFGFELTNDHPFTNLAISKQPHIDHLYDNFNTLGPEIDKDMFDEYNQLKYEYNNPEVDYGTILNRRNYLFDQITNKYLNGINTKAPMWKLDLSNVLGSE